jgi:hypothetical protein
MVSSKAYFSYLSYPHLKLELIPDRDAILTGK